jgi:ArsR family transcriptional regulator
LDRPQANVSQHLAILREAGLVRDERDGMTVVYRVADPRIFDVIARIQALNQTPRERSSFAAPMRRRRGAHCRCPRCRGEPA